MGEGLEKQENAGPVCFRQNKYTVNTAEQAAQQSVFLKNI